MRNQGYEHALDRHGVKWSYAEKVALADIDAGKSRMNQARLKMPIDPAVVEDYAEAMRQKAEFPAVVIWRPGRGRYMLLDGNHRLAAMSQRGFKFCDAYVVETDDLRVRDRVCWKLNNEVNGVRLTAAELMEHAVSFVRVYGVPAKVAAAEWGVGYPQLTARLRVEGGRDVLRNNNVPVTPSLTDDKVRNLHPILEAGEDLFCLAAHAASVTGASDDDTLDLARSVKDAKTAADKRRIIEEFAASERMQARRAETRNGTVHAGRTAPRDKLVSLMRALLRHLEVNEASALKPRSGDWKAVREIALGLHRRLDAIFSLDAKEVA